MNEVQEMTSDYIVEMIGEYHGRIWLLNGDMCAIRCRPASVMLRSSLETSY